MPRKASYHRGRGRDRGVPARPSPDKFTRGVIGKKSMATGYDLAIRAAEPRAVKVCKDATQFEREATFASFSVANSVELMNLAKANPNQLTEAFLQAVASGVSLNPALGLAYLIPRAGKIRLEFGYQGYIQLATGSGAVAGIFVDLVYEGDAFRRGVRNSTPYIDHEPCDKPGPIVGVYCIATLPTGASLPCYMTKAEIDGIRRLSKSPAWNTAYGEMAKKTVIRRARKTWPKQIVALERAFSVDDMAEDIPSPLDDGSIDVTSASHQDEGFLPADDPAFDEAMPPHSYMTKEQIGQVQQAARKAGMKIGMITDFFQVESLQDIDSDQFDSIIERIEAWAVKAKRTTATGKLPS